NLRFMSQILSKSNREKVKKFLSKENRTTSNEDFVYNSMDIGKDVNAFFSKQTKEVRDALVEQNIIKGKRTITNDALRRIIDKIEENRSADIIQHVEDSLKELDGKQEVIEFFNNVRLNEEQEQALEDLDVSKDFIGYYEWEGLLDNDFQ